MSDQTISKQKNIVYDSKLPENRTLKYYFMTSLQNIVLAKIISSSWMNTNIQRDIVDLFHEYIRARKNIYEKWQEIEDNVLTQVSQLHLPISISKRLKYIVSAVGSSMFNWIIYHDKHVFNTNTFSTYSAANLISNIVWSSRGKVDYTETAKKVLTSNELLASNELLVPERYKYKLACIYCLEDEIAALAALAADIVDYFDIPSLYSHPMELFWTARITGDNSKLYETSYFQFQNLSLYEIGIDNYIMQLLIRNECRVEGISNEVPITYMLNILKQDEKAEYITLLIKEIGNQDLRYSLLSMINYEQQQCIFKEYSGKILDGILSDWLWKDYFLETALHFLDIMDPLSYLQILKQINKEKFQLSKDENRYGYNEYKYFFKQLWEKSSKRLKDFVFKHENGRSLEELVFSLSWNREIDIVQIIINDLINEFYLDSMDPLSYLQILKQINEEKIQLSKDENKFEYDEYKSFFKQLWENSSRHLKDFVFEHENGSFLDELVFSLSWEREIDIVQLILNDLDARQKKNIIIRNNGIEHCSHLIENYQWDLLEIFIRCTLSTKADVSQLKQYLVNKKGRTIAAHFLEQNAFDKVEYFIMWAFQSEDEMNLFRKSLYSLKYKDIFKAFIANNKADFTELNIFLKWCANGNQEYIFQFKAKSLDLPCSKYFIEDSITQEKYELLDQVLNWCFLDNEQQIAQFKINICKDDFLYPYFHSLIYAYIEKDSSLEKLDQFIYWSFNNKTESQEFRKLILYPQSFHKNFFVDLLVGNEFKIADKVLEKIIISYNEISEFKKKLMFTDAIIYIFHLYANKKRLNHLSRLVKWFNPSQEMVEELKKLLPEWQKILFKVLDNFVLESKCSNK